MKSVKATEDIKNSSESVSADKGRKLTAAEQKRLDAFNTTADEMMKDGYARKDLTLSVKKANIVGPLLVLPFEVLFIGLFLLVYGITPLKDFINTMDARRYMWFMLSALTFIPCMPLHELIHGISWAPGAKNKMKDIEFGFIKELLTPYCCCRSPLSKGRYIFGSMMPMTVLGAVPCIFGVIFKNPYLMIVGCLQLLGGAGDILITYTLLRYKTKDKNTVLLDHPTDCGLVVFEKVPKALHVSKKANNTAR